MKVTMNRLTSIRSMPVLVLAVLVVLGSALSKGPARDPVSGSGSVTATGPTTFEGTATLIIRGDTFQGTVVVIVEEPPVESEGGVLHFNKVRHEFDFGDTGSFTTTGKERAVPKGKRKEVYNLNGHMEVTDGTGVFFGACGKLSVHGEIDFLADPAPQASFEVHGTISTPAVLIETVTVNSNDLDGEDSTTGLLDGVDYRIEVSGTWTNKAGGPEAFSVDAEYVSYDEWISWQDGPDPIPEEPGERKNQLDLQVNQTFVDWDPYSSDHTYYLDLVGSGSTVNFRVWDGLLSVGPEPGWYPDNDGSLAVKIYQLP